MSHGDPTRLEDLNFQILFEQSEIPVALASVHGSPHFVDASQAFLDACGLRRAQVRGRSLAQVLAPDTAEGLGRDIRRALSTSQNILATLEFERTVGRRLMSATIHPINLREWAGYVMLRATFGEVATALAHAEEHERGRLGRELHDSTTQHLVAAELELTAMLPALALQSHERECVEQARASLRAAQAEIRAFAFLLHDPNLQTVGLRLGLSRFCDGFARRTGLSISVSIGSLPDLVEPELEHAFLRVCQEALMNVYRHAHADHVWVRLDHDGERLVMQIQDDGRGVEGEEHLALAGMGITAMRSRMQSIGGVLHLDRSAGGFCVIATLPIKTDAPSSSLAEHSAF